MVPMRTADVMCFLTGKRASKVVIKAYNSSVSDVVQRMHSDGDVPCGIDAL